VIKYLGILFGLLLLLMPATVLATEYLQPGENGTLYAQVRYLNGTPANNATVNLTLWAANGTRVLDEVSMSYITGSRGIYHYNFTAPATVGVYAVDIITSNPTGYGSDEIHVSDINTTGSGNATVNVTAIWSESIAGYTDTGTFGGILNDFLGGGNMALMGVIGLCAFLMVIGFWRKSQAIMWVATLSWIAFAFWQRSLTPAWGTWDLHEMLFYIGFSMVIVCIVEAVMIYREEQPVVEKRVPEATAAERYKEKMADIRARASAYKIPRSK